MSETDEQADLEGVVTTQAAGTRARLSSKMSVTHVVLRISRNVSINCIMNIKEGQTSEMVETLSGIRLGMNALVLLFRKIG